MMVTGRDSADAIGKDASIGCKGKSGKTGNRTLDRALRS